LYTLSTHSTCANTLLPAGCSSGWFAGLLLLLCRLLLLLLLLAVGSSPKLSRARRTARLSGGLASSASVV
jgi:hypothetical protein